MTAGLMAAGFGCAIAASEGIGEGGAAPSVWLLFLSVGACGMYAFLVGAGAYLTVVRVSSPSRGIRRRAIDAMVAGCASVPIALAFRDWLWWSVGSSSGLEETWDLLELLGLVAGLTFLLVFLSETLIRRREPSPH